MTGKAGERAEDLGSGAGGEQTHSPVGIRRNVRVESVVDVF